MGLRNVYVLLTLIKHVKKCGFDAFSPSVTKIDFLHGL